MISRSAVANFRRGICRLARLSAPVCLLAAGFSAKSRADEGKVPLVTPQNAAQHADKQAALELTVVDVKFAERRQMHFLSSTVNFRSEANLPVAIRATDIEKFHRSGIKDLSASYLGKAIRARGKVVRDENQWLLVVTAPEDIASLDPAGKAAGTDELVIISEQGKRTTLRIPLAEELPRSKISVDHEGEAETYEGVAVAALLARTGVPLGAEARGNLLGRYIVVKGQDGYAVVFSLGEVDPFFAREPALVADRMNGEPLPASKGPLRLVVPGEKHRRRWVGQVTSIEVRNALDKPATGP